MKTKWAAWMVVSILAGPLMAFGGADPETGTVAEQILREAEDAVRQIRTLIEDARRGNPESQFQLGSMIRDNARKWYMRIPFQYCSHHRSRYSLARTKTPQTRMGASPSLSQSLHDRSSAQFGLATTARSSA